MYAGSEDCKEGRRLYSEADRRWGDWQAVRPVGGLPSRAVERGSVSQAGERWIGCARVPRAGMNVSVRGEQKGPTSPCWRKRPVADD